MFLGHLDSGVPASLVRLLAIESKSELEKYAKTVTIQDDELVRLIVNSEEIGYVHFRAHKEFQPDDAQLTTDDLNMLRSSDP